MTSSLNAPNERIPEYSNTLPCLPNRKEEVVSFLDVRNIPRATYEDRVERLRNLMRDNNLDGVVASGASDMPPGIMWWNLNRTYARYLSGFEIRNSPSMLNAIVIVPLEGDLTLVVPPGIRESFVHLARATTWIDNIVASYDPNPETQPRKRWGLISEQGEDVAHALRASGLEAARIGVSGTWSGSDRTRDLLPNATFVPTVVTDEPGPSRDILAPLVTGSTPEEVARLERAHAAADAAVQKYIEVACTGTTFREAWVEGQVAGLRAGASEVVLFGSMSVDPWAFWDLGGADPNEHFREGRIYFTEMAHGAVDGYTIQKARSFVLGEPTADQRRIMAVIRQSVEAIYEAARAGLTGEEVYEVGVRPILAAGLEPWAQLGHNVGVKPWPRSTSFLPGVKEQLHEGQAVVVHVGVTDLRSGQAAMAGDSVLIERDGCRPLSLNPSPLDLLSPYEM